MKHAFPENTEPLHYFVMQFNFRTNFVLNGETVNKNEIKFTNFPLEYIPKRGFLYPIDLCYYK